MTIRKRRVPRDVIVVSGTLNAAAAATTVHLYSDHKEKTTAAGMRRVAGGSMQVQSVQKDKDGPTSPSGAFPTLLRTLADLTGREVVNESATPPDRKVSWAAHRSGRVGDMPPKRAAAKIDMILANVSRQSGLQLRRETRAVDVWEVTAKEPANEPAT